MVGTTNLPLFQVGQQVVVLHGSTWYNARILAIEILFAFPPDKVYQYWIHWEWPGWPDEDVIKEDIMVM
eukprot:11854773-Ditylum_brightwellii.AAC.1